MGSAQTAARIDYDDIGDVLYVMLRIPEHTVGRQNDEGIVFVHDRDTDELVGVMVLDAWERFVRRDGTLDEEALRRSLVAPFSEMIDDIRRELLAT